MDITGPLEDYTVTVTTAGTLGAGTVGHSHTDSELPLELFSRIIDHIDDTATLLSMLVSSQFICREVERKLYHSIRFQKLTAHKVFLESILGTKRSHLPCFVCHYYLFHAPVYNDNFNNLLTHALALFVNLKHLSFSGSYGLPSAKVLPVETPCPFQLHTFQWLRGRDESCLAPFLDGQYSLEVLQMFLGPNLKRFSIPCTSLQRLRNLSGSIRVIIELLQSRNNITRLHWDPFSSILPTDVSLIPPFSHVRVLSFGTLGTRPPLRAIISLLEHIEILELGRIYESELVDLYTLTQLRTLAISHHKASRECCINPKDTFQKMQYLESIALASELFEGSGRVESTAYQRWSRKSLEPVKVDASEAVWWRESEI